MTESYYCYIHWGAKAKIDDLRTRYPQLLNPILEPEQNAVSFAEMTTVANSTNSSSKFLDMATMLKVFQTVAGEIELDKLLIALFKIIITSACGDKCVLVMQSLQNLEVVALVTSEIEPQILSPTSLTADRNLPISLIETVKHNLTPLVLADARIYSRFAGDFYIAEHRPKSILCLPMLNRDKLMGILYLENNLTVGAFTQDRVELLDRICAQAAIAIENIRLDRQS
jgi:GAF domain-containing protein